MGETSTNTINGSAKLMALEELIYFYMKERNSRYVIHYSSLNLGRIFEISAEMDTILRQ